MTFKIINGNLVLISALLCFTVHNLIASHYDSGLADYSGSLGMSGRSLNQFGSRLRQPLDLHQSSSDDFKVKSMLTSHVETQNQIHHLGSLLNSNKGIKSIPGLSKTTNSLLNPFELMSSQSLKPTLEQNKSMLASKPSKDSFFEQVYANPYDIATPDRSLSISPAITANSGKSSERALGGNEEELRLKEELQKMMDEINAIQQAEQQYQSAIETIAEYEKHYQSKFEIFQSRAQQYSSDEQSIMHQREEIEKESQELASQIAQLQSVNANLQMNIKALEESHKQINAQYNELEKSSLSLNHEDQTIRLEILRVEHEDLEYQQKYEELKRQYDNLQTEKHQIEVEKQALEKSKEVIEQQLNTLQDQLKNEKETKKDIEKRSMDVKGKEQGVQSEIEKYTNELIALVNEINDLEKLKRTVNLSVEKIQKDDQALDESIKTLKNKSDCLNTKENQLDEQEKDLDKKETDCKCTKEQLAILMDEKRAVQANQQIINGIVSNAGSTQTLQNPMTFYNSMINANLPNPAFAQNFSQPFNQMPLGGTPGLFERKLTFDVTSPNPQMPMNRIQPVNTPSIPPLPIFNDPYFTKKGGFFTSD